MIRAFRTWRKRAAAVRGYSGHSKGEDDQGMWRCPPRCFSEHNDIGGRPQHDPKRPCRREALAGRVNAVRSGLYGADSCYLEPTARFPNRGRLRLRRGAGHSQTRHNLRQNPTRQNHGEDKTARRQHDGRVLSGSVFSEQLAFDLDQLRVVLARGSLCGRDRHGAGFSAAAGRFVNGVFELGSVIAG